MADRSDNRIVAHYAIERELAARLRAAPANERARVYGEVYDELFQRVPDHPQLAIDPAQRDLEVSQKLHFVSRFLDQRSCLMEIGAGDCAFSLRAAPMIRRGIVVDVSQIIVSAAQTMPNLEVVISDGTSLPVEPGSVDVAFSDQLMEHLHPDDALLQLTNVVRAVRPGGVYICITPNRVNGPHDISRNFDAVAMGFHLREYTGREIQEMFLSAGFTHIDFYAGGRGSFVRIPTALALSAEMTFERLPMAVRRSKIPALAAHVLLGLNIVATR